jgi:hypothetical protein
MYTVVFSLSNQTSVVASFVEAANPSEAIGLGLAEVLQNKLEHPIESVEVYSLNLESTVGG